MCPSKAYGDSIRQDVVTKLRAAGCVFAEDEARLLISAARNPDELADMVGRRASGLPIEYVLGWAEFCGLRIELEAGVFVPRRRTELLVREAKALAKPEAIVVDLCCGSGAVGAALAAGLKQIELHATDIDRAAARCAKRNVAAFGGRVYEGDLFEPLPSALMGRVDLLVANVPYVPTAAIERMPSEARLYEAPAALDGGTDGLDVQRRAAAGAPLWLGPGGHMLVETSERQAPQAVEVFAGNGLNTRVVRSEELEAAVVIGTMPDLKIDAM
ncbi:MAG TPA: putative protein N(5)-glutamine methyltransferase [Bacillales bacterium]|nr:putative protein N(5)-glutamine methyltransferase [Bacillales bacterium]